MTEIRKDHTIVTIAILVCLVFLLAGCGGKGKAKVPAAPRTAPAENPSAKNDFDVTFEHQSLVVPESGPRVWSAEVKSGRASSTSGRMVLQGVTCHMYEHNVEVLQVKADDVTATVTGNTVVAQMSGHLLATAKKGNQRLTAATMQWSSKTNKIIASRFQFQKDRIKLRANHGTLSTDLTDVAFSGHVYMETSGNILRR